MSDDAISHEVFCDCEDCCYYYGVGITEGPYITSGSAPEARRKRHRSREKVIREWLASSGEPVSLDPYDFGVQMPTPVVKAYEDRMRDPETAAERIRREAIESIEAGLDSVENILTRVDAEIRQDVARARADAERSQQEALALTERALRHDFNHRKYHETPWEEILGTFEDLKERIMAKKTQLQEAMKNPSARKTVQFVAVAGSLTLVAGIAMMVWTIFQGRFFGFVASGILTSVGFMMVTMAAQTLGGGEEGKGTEGNEDEVEDEA